MIKAVRVPAVTFSPIYAMLKGAANAKLRERQNHCERIGKGHMKTVMPDYYGQFKCIADKCRHTCCVGWEIDVDDAALDVYQTVPGRLGQKLHQNIVRDDCPHFKLTPEERCPFLNEQNLCELILELGEDSLCQICSDHPRFRNDFSDRTERGLGLCCEAAAELILGRTEKAQLLCEQSDAPESPLEPLEQAILSARSRAFAIVQDRSLLMDARIRRLLNEFEIQMPQLDGGRWAELFCSLEQLDAEWSNRLLQLRECGPFCDDEKLSALEIPFEQLVVYLIYRHLPQAQDETDIKACLGFAVLGFWVLRALCQTQNADGGCTLSDFLNLARLYSSEIEYSEENTDALLELLWAENNR